MSVMTNFNSTPDSIFSATERELLTLSFDEILSGLINDYKSFSRGADAGISIPNGKQELRAAHSCILYAEGLRLTQAHLELAKKLILASLFDFSSQAKSWIDAERMAEKEKENFDVLKAIASFPSYNTRPFAWLKEHGGEEYLKSLLKDIADFEDAKAAEREKKGM